MPHYNKYHHKTPIGKKMNSGIYIINNIINNKVYVGSSSNIERRWKKHKSLLKNNKHHSKYLQSSWNTYGEENFHFIVIEEVKNSLHLIAVEQTFLDYFKSYDKENGYNHLRIANSNLGMKLDQKTKDKIRNANIGKTLCQETKNKIRDGNLGKKHKDLSKQKMREAAKNRKHSQETKEKMSLLKMGEKNHRFGKHHSDEARQKISKGNRKQSSKGYSYHKGKNKYQSYISILGKRKHLGTFDTKEEARNAYLFALEHYLQAEEKI